MVSFEAFRAVDGTPVYLQIINFIKRGAIAGTIRDGDALPPDILDALRREVLSDELRTMARTLRQLGISKEEALRLIEQAWEEEAQ